MFEHTCSAWKTERTEEDDKHVFTSRAFPDTQKPAQSAKLQICLQSPLVGLQLPSSTYSLQDASLCTVGQSLSCLLCFDIRQPQITFVRE